MSRRIIRASGLMLGTSACAVILFTHTGGWLLSFANLTYRPYVRKAALMCLFALGTALAVVFLAAGILWLRKRGMRTLPLTICGIISAQIIAAAGFFLFVIIMFSSTWRLEERVVTDNGRRYVQVTKQVMGEIDRYPVLYPYVNWLVMDKRFPPPV